MTTKLGLYNKADTVHINKTVSLTYYRQFTIEGNEIALEEQKRNVIKAEFHWPLSKLIKKIHKAHGEIAMKLPQRVGELLNEQRNNIIYSKGGLLSSPSHEGHSILTKSNLAQLNLDDTEAEANISQFNQTATAEAQESVVEAAINDIEEWLMPKGFFPYILLTADGTTAEHRLIAANSSEAALDPTIDYLYTRYNFANIHAHNTICTLHVAG
jgi:hypothetical protein